MRPTIKRVGVAGSGTMGAGIAQVAAAAGFEVLLRSRAQAKAEESVAGIARALDRAVGKGKLSPEDRDATMSRLRPVADLDELTICELVIESVVEDLEAKKDLLRQLDSGCGEDTILATNTSTLPVVELATATARPDRVCGLHFFNPAPKMALVEVVPALTTSAATVDALRRFAEDCGKRPVTVKDSAGFVVNALLFPYLNGAVRMLEGGVASRDDIDTAMRDGCGFPMGPLQLLDLVGLDVAVAILERLYDETRDPCSTPAPLLRRMVAAGRVGRKAGQGFYSYDAPDAP